MNAYATKELLVEAYANKLELDGLDRFAANLIAGDKTVYVPHKYRGGYVIREFGYSVERVGKYVPAASAGNPAGV
jgi:hypothetical protein